MSKCNLSNSVHVVRSCCHSLHSLSVLRLRLAKKSAVARLLGGCYSMSTLLARTATSRPRCALLMLQSGVTARVFVAFLHGGTDEKSIRRCAAPVVSGRTATLVHSVGCSRYFHSLVKHFLH
eukprot:3397862-Amphidinium_carterae.1